MQIPLTIISSCHRVITSRCYIIHLLFYICILYHTTYQLCDTEGLSGAADGHLGEVPANVAPALAAASLQALAPAQIPQVEGSVGADAHSHSLN